MAHNRLIVALTCLAVLAPACSREPPPEQNFSFPSPDDADPDALTLSSPAVGDDHVLPAAFTCDGDGVSPPLTWTNLPEGTQSVAVTMHHYPGPPGSDGTQPGAEEKHVYLVAWDIPSTETGLKQNDTTTGQRGTNTVNRERAYTPPCSKGPGAKLYTLTLYALSEAPSPEAQDRHGVTMDDLLLASKDTTLGTATLDVIYARP